jgi:hypothetical protein
VFAVGVHSLILGLLKLGFLLELVSLPVLISFISASALTITSGFNVPSCLAPCQKAELLRQVLREKAKFSAP